MILFMILTYGMSSVLLAYFTIKTFNASLYSQRAMSTGGKYIRDGLSYRKHKRYLMFCGVLGFCMFLYDKVAIHIFIAIGFLLVAVWNAILMKKSTESSERKYNAATTQKYITNMTGQVIHRSADPVTTVAVTAATGNPIIGIAAGDAAGEVGKSVGSTMVQISDTMDGADVAITVPPIDKDVILRAAMSMGIPTDNRSLEDISTQIVKYAPPAVIAELPESLTVDEKAMCIVTNAV